MRLQQHPSLRVPNNIGEELVVRPDSAQPLRDAIFLPPDDIDNGKWQQALGRFL